MTGKRCPEDGSVTIKLPKSLWLALVPVLGSAGWIGYGAKNHVSDVAGPPAPSAITQEIAAVHEIAIENRKLNASQAEELIEQSAIMDSQDTRLGNLEKMHGESMQVQTNTSHKLDSLANELRMYVQYEKEKDVRRDKDIDEIKGDLKGLQRGTP